MKAVIELDVPDWQIGQDVSVYFPDTMLKHGKCELLKERGAVKPRVSSVEQRCGNCNKVIEMDGWKACPWCGKHILWEAVGRSVK